MLYQIDIEFAEYDVVPAMFADPDFPFVEQVCFVLKPHSRTYF